MPDLARRTAAVLVVYRSKAPLDALLAQLAASVARVVVVDNGERPDPALSAAAARHGALLLHGGNRGALAGAYNLALAALQREAGTMSQVVFVDQDSSADALRALLADATTAECLQRGNTAAVAAAYRDRATGLRGRYIVLGRWRLHYLPREFEGLREVAFVINSMSVWRLDALARIGPFDEALALDHIDTEHCLRARRLGLAVHVHGSHVFGHAIGERRRYRLLGRELQAGGHGPARRYLIARNTTWLARRWGWREPAFGFLCLTRLGYEVVGIVMAEDRAAAKLWAVLRGFAAGLFLPRPRP